MDADQIIAEIKKMSPVTRFLCGSSLLVTLSSIIGLIDSRACLFSSQLVFGKLQASDTSHVPTLSLTISLRYGGYIHPSSWGVSRLEDQRNES